MTACCVKVGHRKSGGGGGRKEEDHRKMREGGEKSNGGWLGNWGRSVGKQIGEKERGSKGWRDVGR